MSEQEKIDLDRIFEQVKQEIIKLREQGILSLELKIELTVDEKEN